VHVGLPTPMVPEIAQQNLPPLIPPLIASYLPGNDAGHNSINPASLSAAVLMV
jgi:hypothetical protein